MNQEEKNKIIRDAISATRSKRKHQICKVFKFKVDRSSLTRQQKESLKMFFVECKRVYNYILGSQDLFTVTYKDLKNISYLDKDKNVIPYTLQYLCSSIVSDTITIMKDSIRGLSARKHNGGKVGVLKFKSECNSIRLRQYGVTHTIKGNRFKIQGIKQPIRVTGIKQLNKYNNIEFTVAHLLYDGYDYFISLTCYIDKEKQNANNHIIGIDLGCESTITTSDGDKYKVSIEESERLKGLQAKLVNQIKGSNNWYKTRSKIRKEYNRVNNRKNDVSNKIVHTLIQNEVVIIQDDQLNQWHQNEHLSRTIQHSVLGRIKARLLRYDNVVVLDQWFPTSKHCFECGTDINLKLSDRMFKCPICGAESDRDVHAATNMIEFYKRIKSVGTTDSKPVRKYSYDTYKTLLSRKL